MKLVYKKKVPIHVESTNTILEISLGERIRLKKKQKEDVRQCLRFINDPEDVNIILNDRDLDKGKT